MRYFITVKAKAKEEKVTETDATHFKISVKAPPLQGRANEAVVKVFAEYMDVTPSQVRVVSGHTSKKKVLEIT